MSLVSILSFDLSCHLFDRSRLPFPARVPGNRAVNMEEQSISISLEEFPTVVLDKLVECLDYRSRMTCRLVCQKLKDHVDDIGLSIKIDSRDPGSSELCKNVNVTEAQVLYMKAKDLNLDPQHLKHWKTAILTGPIDETWMMNSLFRNGTNLRVLIIRGECLISQDFSDPSEPLPMFEHLISVQFFLTSAVFTDAVEKVHLILKHKPSMKFYKSMDTRVQKNMACLLKNIRSRVLKTFEAFVMVNICQTDEQRKVVWEHQPLFEFLEKHWKTLEVILVPGLFSGEIPSSFPVFKLPNNLKLLSFSWGLSKKFLSYWKDLLLAQNSLQKLGMDRIPGQSVLPTLQTAIVNNSTTLTSIKLSFTSDTGRISSLDMKMFECCASLQTFMIQGSSETPFMTIRNLNKLPRSQLTSLKFYSVEIGPDFDGVNFMKNFSPNVLVLLGISAVGLFSDLKYMLQFMELVLRCRTLDYLEITMAAMNSSTLPNFTITEMTEIGLQLWFANLRAKEPANHRCLRFDFSDMRDVPPAHRKKIGVPDPSKDGPYVESERAVNLNYMELHCRFEIKESLEQPFLIPRNADSYTIWTNQQTKAYKVQPNTKSYSMRVSDIENRIRVNISFVLDAQDGNRKFRPVDVADLVNPEQSSLLYKRVNGVVS